MKRFECQLGELVLGRDWARSQRYTERERCSGMIEEAVNKGGQ